MSKRQGYGEQRYGVGTKDVSTYAGDWHENCRHGRGTMTYASGNVYEGSWVEVSRCIRCATGENGHPLSNEKQDYFCHEACSLSTRGLLRGELLNRRCLIDLA